MDRHIRVERVLHSGQSWLFPSQSRPPACSRGKERERRTHEIIIPIAIIAQPAIPFPLIPPTIQAQTFHLHVRRPRARRVSCTGDVDEDSLVRIPFNSQDVLEVIPRRLLQR